MFLLLFITLLTVNSVLSAPTSTILPINDDTTTTDNTLENATTKDQIFDFSSLKSLGNVRSQLNI